MRNDMIHGKPLPFRQNDEPEVRLERKIRDHSARLGVIGLGHVGLPLAVEMASAGYEVTGIDLDNAKVESINAGKSYVLDLRNETLFPLIRNGKLRATQSLAAVKNLDAVSICVPTPLRKTKDPDLAYVIASAEAIHNHLRPGQLVVLESTTYPGTTRDVVLPILEKSGLRAGRDFFLAYSPERVDPGNRAYKTRDIPKIIGGVTQRCSDLAKLLYKQFIKQIVVVSSAESAEMVKLLENTFRAVNIALANEIALTCHKLSISVWEIIEAAKTKPFGFMPFYPGPGLGGQSIPVNPYYLASKAKMNGVDPRLIEVAGIINSQMPSFTVERIADALNKNKKSLNGSRILILGVAYKRDTNDVRESPAIEIIKLLNAKGANVVYSDPYVPTLKINEGCLSSLALSGEMLQSTDCAVILADHSAFDYARIVAESPLILDCRNALKDFAAPNIVLI
jgi:UDP-N-acetyl-D-glucosamine dehydrogenase